MTTIPVNDLQRSAVVQARDLTTVFERFLASGRYVHGPEHAAFEAELAAYVGVRHCIGVASGTDALQLALAAVGCDAGAEIVTAANAGGYTSAAARRLGIRIRLADVDPDKLSLSPATVEPELTPTTRAVVVTHLYGLLADVEGIVDLCRARSVAVVEDCAQAVGARRGVKMAGSFGDVAAFSFYPTKNLGALGDGGAVGTDDDEIAERVRKLRQYGWDSKYSIALRGGWNSRLDELQAAVLRIRMGHLDEWNARRREIVRRYARALPAKVGRFVSGDGDDYVAHLAVVMAEDRDGVREQLAAAGVGTDIHYPVADHQQRAWRQDHAAVSLPITEHAVEHVLTVPCFPELTEEEIERVCEVLREL